jgi:ribose transport system substrate-binding protein
LAPQGYNYITHSVEADTRALGRAAALNIVEGLRKRGLNRANIIAITGTETQFTVRDRLAGFRSVLRRFPQYKLVAVEDGNWEDQKSADLAQQLFARFQARGGIQGAYGMADNQVNAIIQAAQQAGLKVGLKNKGLILSGSSCQPLTIKNLRSGLQYGSATNSPVTEAVPNMNTVVRYLQGEKMPRILRVKEERITLGNVKKFASVCNF